MSKYIRGIGVFDNHGHQYDEDTVSTVFKFIDIWKPHDRVHGGDNWNFAGLRKGASEEEKAESMEDDFDDGMEFLNKLRPTHITWGNHDYRIFDLASHGTGATGDLARRVVRSIEEATRKFKCETKPYDSRYGILDYAKNLKIAHGYYHNVNHSMSMAFSYGNIMYGHNHTFQQSRVSTLEVRIAQSVGCLCDINMDFEHARTAKLKKENGFAYWVKNTQNNMVQYWLARKIGDEWVLPTDIVTI